MTGKFSICEGLYEVDFEKKPPTGAALELGLFMSEEGVIQLALGQSLIASVAAFVGWLLRATLVADVPLIKNGSSTIYVRFGDVIAWIASTFMLVGLIAAFRLRRGLHPPASI